MSLLRPASLLRGSYVVDSLWGVLAPVIGELSPDPANWTVLFSFDLLTNPFVYTDEDSDTESKRYYLIRLVE